MRSVILMGASSYANATVHIPRSITIARSRDSVFFHVHSLLKSTL